MPLRENDLPHPQPDPPVVKCIVCGHEGKPCILPSHRVTCDACGSLIRPIIPDKARF